MASNLGFGAENYRFHDHEKLATMLMQLLTLNIECLLDLRGRRIHSRTDFDLKQHESIQVRMQY